MKKEQRIKKNKEFSLVFNKGTSVANRQFVIYALAKEEQNQFRLGLSVSKKVGNAVTRNRVKRMIRTFFQTYKERLHTEYDFVVIARKPVATMEYAEVEASLLHVLRKGRYLKKHKKQQFKND
ncbi:ribonuclease P protein component [Alkalihalobacillus pseudalcaliphilus]|uniref:ribonuclease P protein component n=1 Tax=Alkalihalobacillus pseudalcaliphilus TaxID=79884 RepID=UPI00064DD650|nr:ribonuclease P protein component [Alkalihalobacillus pseudalcaliphilus]KMK77896.1 ribonuclease P [Alkalihalobacillus pseudalcaliphilus]